MANPKRPPYPVQLRTWIDRPFPLYAGGAPDQPFAQFDWPKPIILRVRFQHTQPQGSPLPVLTTLIQQPFAQLSWPAPVRARQLQGTQPSGSPITLLSIPAAEPFRQSHWPAPLRRPTRFYSEQRPPFMALLTTANPIPFAQLHWPLPMRARQPMSRYGFIHTHALPLGIPISDWTPIDDIADSGFQGTGDAPGSWTPIDDISGTWSG